MKNLEYFEVLLHAGYDGAGYRISTVQYRTNKRVQEVIINDVNGIFYIILIASQILECYRDSIHI